MSGVIEHQQFEIVRAFAASPNPTAGRSAVRFELPREMPVNLGVVDAAGRTVARLAEGTLAAGPHRYDWDAGSLATGVYYCVLAAGDRVETRPIVITR